MNDQSPVSDRLITDTEVAAIYSIARSTVWAWADRGLIPKPVISRHKFARSSHQQVQDAIEKLKKAERVEIGS